MIPYPLLGQGAVRTVGSHLGCIPNCSEPPPPPPPTPGQKPLLDPETMVAPGPEKMVARENAGSSARKTDVDASAMGFAGDVSWRSRCTTQCNHDHV